MPVIVLVGTLFAAVLHASWNAIAHKIPDKTVAFTLVNLGSMIGGIPLVCLAPIPDPRSWIFLGASAALHLAYNGLLMASYRLGDLSQTYPLARGTSPLVVTLAAAVFLGELPSAGQISGVLLISTGLACLVGWGYRAHPARPTAIYAALATGLMIASYTTVDGVGVRLSHSTLGYIGWLMLLGEFGVPLAALTQRRRALLTDLRPFWLLGLTGGLCSVLAYGIILWAQTRADLADVAALRESSIIVGALIGTLWFKESFGAPRIVATCAVTAGIALMYLA
ncbi:DMT family transporter [Nocardia sp. CDC160]|uniref:DMT family transporter n=1 Tax=Nocardia sp. CDC160 TaxID=3112166 RepID=UPI002DC0291B|nr:DMT family transporter [Nocardia sp. CDC160]MEC3917864.1 DMT family transporter [Nocardia sp. CDC160]